MLHAIVSGSSILLRPVSLQVARPALAHEVVAEAVVPFLFNQLEAGSLVDAARPLEDVVGPQHHLAVAGAPREPQALVDQPGADPHSPCGRLDEQESQLRDAVLLCDAKDTPRRLSFDLGDPRPLPCRLPVLDEVRDDVGDKGLEGVVPPVLGRIEGAMTLHHPAEVSWLGRPQDNGHDPAGTVQDLSNRRHGADEPSPIAGSQWDEKPLNLLRRTGVEHLERRPPPVSKTNDLATAVGARALFRGESVSLEAAEDTTQISRIDVECPAKTCGIGSLTAGELEEHARLGERVRAAKQTFTQDADHVGIETIERSHRGHLLDRDRSYGDPIPSFARIHLVAIVNYFIVTVNGLREAPREVAPWRGS